ncbi:Hsp70 family protein [Rutstroemia sp. NJR-2017a BBW]|nr:Hsp70 family protein [Rutstroemia sp. NJR-2017a BBW]
MVQGKWAQSAVVRGAALRGLEGIAPRVKRLRRHYGVVLGKPFRKGVDPEHLSFINSWNNKKKCDNTMCWFISKGDEITKDTFRRFSSCIGYTPGLEVKLRYRLYACALADPPYYSFDDGVEHVGDIEAILSRDHQFGQDTQERYNAKLKRSVHQLSIQNEVVLGNKGDNLTFRSLIDSKEVSNSVIRFDH